MCEEGECGDDEAEGHGVAEFGVSDAWSADEEGERSGGGEGGGEHGEDAGESVGVGAERRSAGEGDGGDGPDEEREDDVEAAFGDHGENKAAGGDRGGVGALGVGVVRHGARVPWEGVAMSIEGQRCVGVGGGLGGVGGRRGTAPRMAA